MNILHEARFGDREIMVVECWFAMIRDLELDSNHWWDLICDLDKIRKLSKEFHYEDREFYIIVHEHCNQTTLCETRDDNVKTTRDPLFLFQYDSMERNMTVRRFN